MDKAFRAKEIIRRWAGIFPLSVLLAAGCTAPIEERSVQETITAIEAEHVPDSRLEVFDIDSTLSGSVVSLTGDVGRAEWAEAVVQGVEALGLGVENKIRVLPDESIGEQTIGFVTISVANLRRRPSHPSELVTQALMGDRMLLLRREGGWYLVQGPDNYLGWLEGDAMALMSETEATTWAGLPMVIFTEVTGTVRSDTTDKSAVVCDAASGDIFSDLGKDRNWWKVGLPDSREGYLPADDVRSLEEWRQSRRLIGESVEMTARRFLGIPYLWGGTSVKGFDCSGLSKTVFALNGFQLLRDADQQARQGEPVALEPDYGKLTRGDLLFFGRKATERSPERITHVAIYLQDGDYIHATPGYVQINSLNPNSPVYSEGNANRLLKARRVISSR